MRAGKIGSFRSCAVSTSIRNGPFGHSTAIRSQTEITARTAQTVHSGKYLMNISAISADIIIK